MQRPAAALFSQMRPVFIKPVLTLFAPHRPRSYRHVSVEEQLAAAHKEIEQTKADLAEARRRLHDQSSQSPHVQDLLHRLTQHDLAAHKAATEMRYTALALELSAAKLEVELRRILSIGLTAEEVDAAAIEAGARQWIRSSVGFRAANVSEEPPVAISLGTLEMRSERKS